MTSTYNESVVSKPTGGFLGLPDVDSTRTSVYQKAGSLRTDVRHVSADITSTHRDALRHELETDSRRLLKSTPASEMLNTLRHEGFSWRTVARMLGVSVPAIQKWRRGEKVAPANAQKLAHLVALVAKLKADHLVNDVASWMEMPIKEGVHLVPIDLVSAGRTELIFEHASEHASPEEVLDAHDVDWREKLVDSQFETFQAMDGFLSIRPKN